MSDITTNAQKLAIAIGLMKTQKCKCSTKTPHACDPSMRIPIIEIDGVKNIDCRISYCFNKSVLKFEVTADFKYDGDEDENPILFRISKISDNGITAADTLAFSTAVLTAIPLLKLDFEGNLAPFDKCSVDIYKAIDDVFSSIACPTVVVDCMQECSVCYEKTRTKTKCNHSLCNRCWSKIEEVKDEDGDLTTPCPICRENIHYI
jgi:hypothetical protein